VVEGTRRARDLALLDAIDAFRREALDAEVWRVVRSERDPALGSPSRSRWCDSSFDVLYTSFERDGAIAEIHALLSLQPVFPSKERWLANRLKVAATQTIRFADLATLAKLGVDAARYTDRDYRRTQAIADAAFFLGFDGLIAPSARWRCLNCILFTDRVPPDQIQLVDSPEAPVSWEDWRKTSTKIDWHR
jgi:RES domain